MRYARIVAGLSLALLLWQGAQHALAAEQVRIEEVRAVKTGNLQWTPASVEAELRRYEPALAEFGIRDPLRWIRARVEQETDWTSPNVQAWWERRIAHWRFMLLDENAADWGRWLDLDHPSLASRKADLLSGGPEARKAWAAYVATRPGLRDHLRDHAVRTTLYETVGNGIYAPDGTYVPERAEALLEGKVHLLHLPVEVGEADYGWVQTTNPAGWFLRYVPIAYYHQQDPRWVREFQNEVVAMVLGYEIAGYTGVATRLRFVLPTYLLMKDSPAMSERFHAICARWMWAHASQLDRVGATGYKDNTLPQTGLAQWMAAALFPEFNGSKGWRERLWPLLEAGYRRELLDDGCHKHRSLSYHLTFVYRGLSLLALARTQETADDVPKGFRELVRRAVDAFVPVSTPIRSTPGVNDDWTVSCSYRDTLQVAADLFGREDWLYLATDGRGGKAPREQSMLLPAAQLAVMRSDWSRNARWLSFNVSPDGGHHHLDTLGIQMWAGGRKLLVEPYTGDYIFERDAYNRSWWHSTPTLGKSQLPTKVDPRMLHWETGPDLDYAVGQIIVPVGEGQAPARFRRHIFFVDRAFWVLWDEFIGVPGDRTIWENFHFSTRKLELSSDGRSVATTYPDGTNLRMVVGSSGWTMHQEDTRMWPVYSRDTTSTATLHYKADATTAARGFGALFVPLDSREVPPATSFGQIERLADGRVRLQVRVAGNQRELTTRSYKVE